MASKYTIHAFSQKITKHRAWRPQNDAQSVPMVAQALPGAVNRSPKCSKKWPRAFIFGFFLNFLRDLGPRAFKVASGVQFWLKTTLRTTKNITNIHNHFGKLDILRRMTKHATQLLSPFCTNIFSLRKNLQNIMPFKIDCCLSDGPCNCPRYYRN